MATFIYSPGIQVLVGTEDNGIIDLSEDVTQGSVTLRENNPSTLDISVLNHRRKYDGMFTPNDIIVLKLKRLAWLPIFSGYLNQVPYFSVFPRSVRLTATDTLKRLQMSVWDSGSQAAFDLLSTTSGASSEQVDGGLRDKIIAVMNQVAGWPTSKIHVGHIPNNWSEKFEPLREKLAETINVTPQILGTSGVTGGSNNSAIGAISVPATDPGTGTMPATSGKVGQMAEGRTFELTAESSRNPNDQLYIAMRFPYRLDGGNPISSEDYLTPAQTATAKKWWKNRRLLVTNPANDRAMVVRAVSWGPVDTSGRVAETSALVLRELGAKVGDNLEYRFAPENIRLGRVERSTDPSDSKYTYQTGGVASTNPTYVETEDGKAWTSWNGLAPHVAAARLFVKANWNIRGDIGGKVVRNIAGTSKPSDHATGHAIDIGSSVKGGSRATGQWKLMGNSIAQWFVANPEVFKTKYVIWFDRANYGNGWREYKHPSGTYSNTYQHRDHVHVSFKSGSYPEAGAMGSPWPGAGNENFVEGVGTTNGAGIPVGEGSLNDVYAGVVGPNGLPLLNAFNWFPVPDPWSAMLSGPRALMNDKPVLETIQQLTNASQRSFMAAPNGDFIAWFPDYFGQYGTASTMIIRDIELAGEGFTVAWDDARLITHQFVAGSSTGFNLLVPGEQVTTTNQLNTMGIATVEFTELMESLFNVPAGSKRAKYLRNAEDILRKHGARVDYQPIGRISGQEAEFWYAVWLFQRNWAAQFSSKLDLNFMPEIWPGMLVKLETYKFQAYVEQVTHRWSMTQGGFGSSGGFHTEVSVIAPSTTDRSGFYELPFAGGEEPEPIQIGGGRGGSSRVL